MRRLVVTKKYALGLMLSASLAACGTLSSDPSSDSGAVAEALPSPYDGTSWELVRWASAGGLLRQIPRRADGANLLTLEFVRDDPQVAGRVSGFAGCNRYAGSYRYDAQYSLALEGMATTRMACSPDAMALERAYLQGLGVIVSAAPEPLVQPRHLVLVLDDGDVLSFMRRSDNNEEIGRVRQIYVDDHQVSCTGMMPQRCYRVRDSQESPWQLFYGNIEGFEFQPGTSYLLSIREIQVDHPPADASSVRWVLDGVLEQRSVVE